MDRLLRPKVFETSTSDPNAEKLYKHWKMTFQNYIKETVTEVAPGVDGDDTSLARAAAETTTRNRKLRSALINNISADIFELISDCTDYLSSIEALDKAYIRPTSVVYGRHKLITTKQEPGQSVDQFKQELERLAKSCNFQAVSAEEHRNQYMRDALIKGIASPQIRQRLLENIGNLSLDQAFAQARQLEQAQSQSASYEINAIAAVPETEDELAAMSFNKNNNNNNNNSNNINSNNNFNKKTYRGGGKSTKKESCWFCGRPRHPRIQCPAKDANCGNCGIKGHFKEVCNSGRTLPVGAMDPPQDQPSLA